MLWKIITLLIILGIGTPILMRVYDGFVNSQNGSWVNWTVSYTTACGTTACVTAYQPYELGIFQFIPLLAALMALGFLAVLISGRFEKKEGQ